VRQVVYLPELYEGARSEKYFKKIVIYRFQARYWRIHQFTTVITQTQTTYQTADFHWVLTFDKVE